MQNRLTKIARLLRRNSTPEEEKLWYFFKNKNFEGLKFRRQYPIGDYVVDFYCPSKKLIIELDGGGRAHAGQIIKDNKRDNYLRNQGFNIFRIENDEIHNNLDGVLEEVYNLVHPLIH